MFDLGFLAVSQGAKAFLDFWAERLRHDAIVYETDLEEFEELPLLCVVGAGGIAERGADPAETLCQEFLFRQLLLRRIPLATRLQVEELRKCLCKSVRERLDHDRTVVVVLSFVT